MASSPNISSFKIAGYFLDLRAEINMSHNEYENYIRSIFENVLPVNTPYELILDEN